MLEWSDDYEIGALSVDNAHREIFQMAGTLLAEENFGSQAAVTEAIEFMKDYVWRHFEDEEKLMRQVHFPKLAEHRAQHRRFREVSLPAIEKKLLGSNYSRAAMQEFVELLGKWLTEHIVIFDRQIGDYIAK